MPCIVRDGTFSVYVYANDHAPPHCHVIWDGGDKNGVVDLTSMRLMAGESIPRAGMRLVRDNQAVLLAAWNDLNPSKIMRGTKKRWQRSDFFIVEAVEYRPDEDRVRVFFRNRDIREVETGRLWGKRPGLPDWNGVRIDAATKSALLVPTAKGQPTTEGEIAEIPSDVIREAVDDDYRIYVQERAAAWRKRIG